MVDMVTFEKMDAALLHEVQDMSTALYHGVQLVIGAVTIQVTTCADLH